MMYTVNLCLKIFQALCIFAIDCELNKLNCNQSDLAGQYQFRFRVGDFLFLVFPK